MRAWWWHRQGLDATAAGWSLGAVLSGTGWARSVGGVNPYLTLFARTGASRVDVDAAVADLAVHELPAARGCTYVVPATDFGLALQAGKGAPEAEAAKAGKLGVLRDEIDKLCAAVLDALADGPLDPSGLKDVLGDAVRNLGDQGRKKGLTTTLPVALGLLQSAGEVRRVPLDGRLDRQRFSYVRWNAPHSGLDDEEARVELARRYLSWTGAASLAHLRWFTALSARDAKASVAELDAVEVEPGLLALPEDAKAYTEFRMPDRPRYALLAGIDALVLLRRDLPSLLSSRDVARPVPGEPSGKTLGELTDLPDFPIVDRGRVAGLWQYDVDTERIVWWVFDGAAAKDPGLLSEVEKTEAYVRDELGDARSYSLDSPKSRAPRLAALRAQA
ncbi:MAG: hypothetical protein GEU98_24585 [Pseudonocardiaceae bacterium]|nr:hypothetical protein [Pseudonocardiaceae bacterium]